MNVRELKEFLEEFDNDLEIYVAVEYRGWYLLDPPAEEVRNGQQVLLFCYGD